MSIGSHEILFSLLEEYCLQVDQILCQIDIHGYCLDKHVLRKIPMDYKHSYATTEALQLMSV